MQVFSSIFSDEALVLCGWHCAASSLKMSIQARHRLSFGALHLIARGRVHNTLIGAF